MYSGGGYGILPLQPMGLASQRIFESAGMVAPQPRCHAATRPGLTGSSLLQGSAVSTMTVDSQNAMSFWVANAWCVLVTLLVLYNVISVIWVPAKRAGESPRKLRLADDEGAWSYGIFHWAGLSWVDDLMARYGKCLHAVIDDNEIVFPRSNSADQPSLLFKQRWAEEIARAGSMQYASLARALCRTIGWKALLCLVTAVTIEHLASLVGMVIALDKFVTYLEYTQESMQENPDEPFNMWRPTLLVVVLVWGVPTLYRFSSILVGLLDGYYTNLCSAGLASIVFDKALDMPAGSCQPEEVGKAPHVVQLLNVDIMGVWSNLLRQTISFMLAPVFVAILFAMLLAQIKTSAVIGFLYCIPCLIVVAALTFAAYTSIQKYQGYTDSRLRVLGDAIMHIRNMKSLSWESVAYQKLEKYRSSELRSMRSIAILMGSLEAALHVLPWGTVLCAIVFLRATRGNVQAHEVIVIQRIMSSLLAAIRLLTNGMPKILQIPNSLRRIKAFLQQPDKPSNVIHAPPSAQNAPLLRMHGSFSFVKGRPPVLQGLDVAIPRGELVGIVGAAASGKSAFLQAVIGELFPSSQGASIDAPLPGTGQVAYCAQVPWIFEGTLRENVVLTQTFDEFRYSKAIFAAGLTPDLETLPGGDQVALGTDGVRLSAGQGARVALARAAFMESAELIVIDDPFASVDASTGEHICNELLLGPLLRRKTRLVTCQPSPAILRNFDRVFVIEDGRIVDEGPPAQVMAGERFKRLRASEGRLDEVELSEEDVPALDTPSQKSARTAMVVRRMQAEPPNRLREVEAQDHITWSSVWWWLKAAGFFQCAAFFALVFATKYIELSQFLVLATWIDVKVLGGAVVDDYAFIRQLVCILGVMCLAIVGLAFAGVAVSLSASCMLHRTVVYQLFKAPIGAFFDKQPLGRLVNRLSYDMKQVDEGLITAGSHLLLFLVGMFVTQTFILTVVPLTTALLATPFYGACFFLFYVYRGTAVPLVFHAKFSLSQLQDLQAAALTSCVSIRANGMRSDFQARHNHHSQSLIRSNYLVNYVCQCWLQSRVFLCFSALTGIFAMGGLWGGMQLGTLSVIISLCFQQMEDFDRASLTLTTFLNFLTAVQRLTKYLDIPQEAPTELPHDPQWLRLCVARPQVAELGAATGKEARALLARSASPSATPTPPLAGASDAPVVVYLKSSRCPVLQVTQDGTALELIQGRRFRDLFPGCEEEALGKVEAACNIVGVNSSGKIDEMVEGLCNPTASLWLDLRHDSHAKGPRVQLEELSAGYGTDRNVLEGISLDIAPGSKVGFAGATGSGKSTMLLCLLRMLEPREGRILVGGMDSQKLGLKALRTIFGLAPQDPTIFEGTVRFNVDPLNEFSDASIWEALTDAQFKIPELGQGLNYHLAKNGGNLSLAQRQLLSLARMALRQPPVLLLDECTSALDPCTQEEVQGNLLHKFPRSTVIAVAHRVETILDFERIVVFEAGRVVEDGTVESVLKIPNGIFARMVSASK
jgi:ABC-type multidrug transport system fused ATPase/permease subunit